MSEPPYHRVFRRRALFWCVNGVGLLALYALAYPVIFDTFEGRLPDFMDTALYLSVAPLESLRDKMPLYEAYLEWLFDLMP